MKVLKSSFIQSVSLVKSEGEATSLFKLIKSAAQDVLKEALCREPNRNLFLIWTKREFIPFFEPKFCLVQRKDSKRARWRSQGESNVETKVCASEPVS